MQEIILSLQAQRRKVRSRLEAQNTLEIPEAMVGGWSNVLGCGDRLD